MLRNDTLSTIKGAIARGESVSPTSDMVSAIHEEARHLRAEALRRVWRQATAAFGSVFRTRDLMLHASRIDVVRGH